MEPEGFSPKKPREWNEKGLLVHWRESWADSVNAALEQAGREERVDHRSLKNRGIDRQPEPKIGVAATAMKRRGVEADPERFQAVRRVKLLNEVRPLLKSIRQTGNVIQHGVGTTWWEKSTVFMSRLRERAGQFIGQTWQRLIGTERPKGEFDGPER